jgi:aminoglycoside 6'-N-acetyltransferase
VTIALRPATAADAPLLTYWDTKPHVIAATGSDDAEDWYAYLADDPDWRWVFIAEDDGRPIGIIQLIDAAEEETHYWGDAEPNLRGLDIWIGEEDDLGRGFGTDMMRLAIAESFADPSVVAIVIDPLESNHRARHFYQRLGFVEVGPRRFGDDECMVYRLDRDT